MSKGYKPRVCYLRGSFLNPFESQYLEPLQEDFEITAAYSRSHRFPLNGIQTPRAELACLDYLNGFVPRRIAGFRVPNALKLLGHEEVLFGLDRLLPQFDIVHSQEQTFTFAWQAAKRKDRYGYKLLTVQCQVDPFWYMHSPAIARRAALVREKTDLFIARSERAKTALISEGVEPERIRVIGHGVDLTRFHPGPRSSELGSALGIDPGRLVILFIGRLEWAKGVFPLVDAAKLLLERPRIKALDPLFLMVGSGSVRASIEKRLKLLGIERSFVLLGNQPYERIPEIHRLADIFVLPSIAERYVVEQFGIVLIESMATGVPVISTHSGAIEDVVGEAGILVPQNNSYSLFRALEKLVENESLRRELGACGLERVQRNFTQEIITGKLAFVYWEALR